MAHQLVSSYGMLEKMHVIRPSRATGIQMSRFHTDEYIDFLNRVTPETVQEMTHGGTRFLVGEDNPAFEGLFEFCSISAGGSINAAERLNAGKTDIAVNWAGGLHHAKKRDASGFCYVNDINLAILELLRYHARVLYIDIDCHHGDGVEEAFYSTDRVLTCSFHKQKDYFPGTGRMEDVGKGKGKGYSVNVPLLNGVTDEEYQSIFEPVIRHIMEWYRPGAVVLQCGADSLANDKLGVFNLSMHGHANCVRFLRSYNVPLILLGGGGYTIKNVSCVWTYETACAVGMENEIDLNLPYSPYLEYYGPRYRLEVAANNMQNDNPPYLENIKVQILEGLRDLPFAPSVGLHQVPGTDLAEETGIRVRQEDEDSDVSDLDVEIAQRVRTAYNDLTETSSSSSDSDSPLQRRSLMSYFREAERPKRRYPLSDGEDVSDPDDDETEDEEPWNQGRQRSKTSRRQLEAEAFNNNIHDVDDLVFGGRSWLAAPTASNDPADGIPHGKKQRADGNPRRWFFQKDGGPNTASQIDRAVAVRQNGLELSNAEDGLDQEEEDPEDLDDMDDGLDTASAV
ncbi:histone deacetylase (class I) Clr6 [Tulasnella sp. JGI-2019a]|nr:histone deacetylase (class I) Clr6 [Tulasnella sp. JGI-2019a]